MATKKNLTQDDIIKYYMDYVLEHNEEPASVYKFAKENKFDEQVFYKNFASFESIKNEIFSVFFKNTLEVLVKSEDFQDFDARNQLLSFYFTFFENMTANRSYVLFALQNNKNKLQALKSLSGLREHFKHFVDNLSIEKLDLKQETLEKIQNKAISEGAWIQFLMAMKFWMDDTSASFEKTDLFIEKSVNASFDLMNIAPMKSVIDFGKFLFKEKMKK